MPNADDSDRVATADDPSAPSEGDTQYDGALSYAAEWHALSHGVYKGLTSLPWQTPPVPDTPDVAKESHYYRGGYVLGTLIQVAILLAFGEATLNVSPAV